MITELNAKVHFIAGKGGVGKTLICQALARSFSVQNKTLLIELSEEETEGEKLNIASIKKEVEPNLSYVKIFPDQALYEYLSLKLPKKVVNSLLGHQLFRALSSAMPGLSDLTRLGKIWFHADSPLAPPADIYEKIVVDMPSSGFVGRFLSIAKVVKEAVKIGPLAKEAEMVHQYFKSPLAARVHLVTILEEMVTNETIELYKEISYKQDVNLGLLFINRVFLPKYSVDSCSRQFIKKYPTINAIVNMFNQRIDNEAKQRDKIIDNNLMLPQISIGEQIGEMLESKIVQEICKEITTGLML